ncbi:MAG: hypothetical protein COA37_15365 [Hoeflea sp.]|uniref:hypothetical protein n=1 Tax=Hoeflea sp. TaxID=1940281 RepID=UPI000C0FFC01|nr:hypothetical protein [Hoeflea sp.]PHR20410.1 MAG: hypothetical protein COA37_15365 [Hoeflea sp.]
MTEFLSDHLKATRNALKPHVHGGKMFSSEEITGLIGRFDELVAMALSQETALSRHEWNEAACREAMIAEAGNVVAFPAGRLPFSRWPSDGGTAA